MDCVRGSETFTATTETQIGPEEKEMSPIEMVCQYFVYYRTGFHRSLWRWLSTQTISTADFTQIRKESAAMNEKTIIRS